MGIMPSVKSLISTAVIAALGAVAVLLPLPWNHMAAAGVSAVALWLKAPGSAPQ